MPEISAQDAKDTQVLQFPWKLHSILNSPELSSVVTWMPNGESFRILSKDRFATEIMPAYFSSTSYKTFQRSLNLWGFRILLKGPQRGECFHPLFQRGKPGLCEHMTRVKLRGKYTKRKKSLEDNTITNIKATVAKSLPLTPSIASDSEAQKEGSNEGRTMMKRLMAASTSAGDSTHQVIPTTPAVLPISPLATMSPPFYYGINFNGNSNSNNGCINNNNHNLGPFLLQAAAETILQQQREAEICRHLIHQVMAANSPPPYPMNRLHMMNQLAMSAANHGTDHQKLPPRTKYF